MTTIIESLIVFFIANPIGFLSAMALMVFLEYLIIKNIITDPFRALTADYIADTISDGLVKTQSATLKAVDALLSFTLSLVKNVEKEADWQLYKLHAHDSQKLIALRPSHLALQRINAHHLQ